MIDIAMAKIANASSKRNFDDFSFTRDMAIKKFGNARILNYS